MSINLYTNKGLFNLNPVVGIMQFMFIRGVISTVLMTLWSYGSLKITFIDSIDKSNIASLVFRCLQGAISLFITFLSIKFFNVSTVGIVCSLTPLFVCLFAYFLLGERL
jgi:drug/metabolite transporter (DMT)-like permease